MADAIKEHLGLSEFQKKNGVWKALLAEFLGCLLLNYFGCGSTVGLGGHQPSQVLIGLTFGFVIMAIVQSIGHVSGAHVNPAVTAGMLAIGNIPVLKGLLYIVVQCLGSITGSAVLKALMPEQDVFYERYGVNTTLGMTTLERDVTPVQGFGVEFFLGFVLVLVVCGVCDPNKPECKGFAPLVIGLTIALGHLHSVDFTGAAMNPARALGSAVISDIWANHWVYWLGPILGGVAAALLYKHVLSAPSVEVTTEYTPVQLKRLDKNKDEDGMA